MQRWGRYQFTPVLPLGRDGKLLTGSREHIDLSRKIAAEGMVLHAVNGVLTIRTRELDLRHAVRIGMDDLLDTAQAAPHLLILCTLHDPGKLIHVIRQA